MPAKTSPPEVTTSALTLFDVFNPLLTGVHLSPLLVERKIPPPKSQPAKMSPLELIAKEIMKGLTVIPVFTAVQLSPSSVERKTPPPQVPAKIWPLALAASA